MASLENFAIFAVSQFQYIILVIVFSKGSPYREPIFKNRPLLVSRKLMMLCQSLQCDSVAGGHGHPWCLFPLLDLEARGLAGASVSLSICLPNFLPLFVCSLSFAETFRPAATTSCCFLLLKTLATGSSLSELRSSTSSSPSSQRWCCRTPWSGRQSTERTRPTSSSRRSSDCNLNGLHFHLHLIELLSQIVSKIAPRIPR